MTTLLDKALRVPRKRVPRRITRGELQLALAYARGRITGKQVRAALGKSDGHFVIVQNFVSATLLGGVRQGWLTEDARDHTPKA